MFEGVVQGLGVARILRIEVLVVPTGPDAPTDRCQGGVCVVPDLVPPTIQCAEVQGAVHSCLHASDAARLERPPGSVQPQVDASRESLVHRDVEVLDEDDPVFEMSLATELDDLAQQFLSELVAGVRLAAEDDLDRPVRITEDACDAVGVTQEQRGSFVCDEASDEADGESVGVQDRVGGRENASRRRHGGLAARCGGPG